MRKLLVIGLFASAVVAIGCSPEASRSQSGGPGADIGNRAPVVDLHGAINMYYHTPELKPTVR